MNVAIKTGTVIATAPKAFTYYTTSDPIFGGLGGARLAGNLNVTVIDAISGNLVDNASVFAGDPLTTSHRGLTDAMGQIVFSGPDLVGKQTVTAAKTMYETQSVVSFDAQDVTIFLVPIPPPPQPGTLPPGRFASIIDGSISFGGATGVGTTTWDLVPDPRTPTEHKVAHVFTTNSDIFSPNISPGLGANINYVANLSPAPRSWSYRIVARPGALAVIAVAGLEDSDTKQFTPFAMGVHRNVVTGPGENAVGIDISVDLPLDVALSVDLKNPPALRTLGPDGYEVDAYVDLGGEGVIVMPGSAALVLPGSHLAVIGNQPPILRTLSDSSYTIVAKAETGLDPTMPGSGGPPESVRVLTGVTDVTRPIEVDGWHGVPHAIDPIDGGTASGRKLVWAPDGGQAIGTFNFMVLETLGSPSVPVWRFVSRGDVFSVDMPDLRTINATLPDVPPPPEDLFWAVYSVTVPGVTFDQFTYNQLNQKYWSAHALNFFTIQVPASAPRPLPRTALATLEGTLGKPCPSSSVSSARSARWASSRRWPCPRAAAPARARPVTRPRCPRGACASPRASGAWARPTRCATTTAWAMPRARSAAPARTRPWCVTARAAAWSAIPTPAPATASTSRCARPTASASARRRPAAPAWARCAARASARTLAIWPPRTGAIRAASTSRSTSTTPGCRRR